METRRVGRRNSQSAVALKAALPAVALPFLYEDGRVAPLGCAKAKGIVRDVGMSTGEFGVTRRGCYICNRGAGVMTARRRGRFSPRQLGRPAGVD